MAQRWYVVRVKKPSEARACAVAMRMMGLEAFAPIERTAEKTCLYGPKRWHLVDRQLIPGYVFARLDLPSEGWAAAVRYVDHILPGKGSEPLPVKRAEEVRIEALREAEEANSRLTLDDCVPKKERRRRHRPALWEQYVAASSGERESVLGEKLREAVMGLLEPAYQVEEAA